ncbi:MAG: DUF1799 domain-containing protein [Gammaproteobacteria bacterium]|nr:DUF1799 domain-containing protein [Gammaproteobacteria bacterium]
MQLAAGAQRPQRAVVDENVVKGMRAMKATEEQIAKALARRAPKEEADQDFEVHEDAWESWCFFLKVQTQWVYLSVPGGGNLTHVLPGRVVRVSMNYPGIASMASMWRIRQRKLSAYMDDLAVIEGAVLKEDNRLAATRRA